MRRSLIAGLILALAPAVHGQAVTVDVPDGATHRIEITGPVRYVYGPSGLTITFGPAPAPEPTPAPAPRPTPEPTPKPAPPAWGALDRVIILYESSRATGREAFYSLSVVDALNNTAPQEAGPSKLPRWRVWDKDLAAPDSSVAVESREWSDALAKAKAAHGGSADPVLYAFDKDGRLKAIPLKGLTDEDAAKAVRGLIAK